MSWVRGAFGATVGALVLALMLGFVAFVAVVGRAAAPDPPPRAHAIVALTGGSQERLTTGVRLLAEGRAERLLISGVDRAVRDHELFAVIDAPDRLAACCIDLGRAAEDTLGNASETAAWARARSFRRIILVTDDYHMPRSVAEMHIALPEAEVIPYPVRTRWTQRGLWLREPSVALRLGTEYLKYITIRFREFLLSGPAPAQ